MKLYSIVICMSALILTSNYFIVGKTVQSIAFLGWLKQTARARRPHLIVVPASTLSNWEIELARFCPSLRVTSYQGSFSERHSLQYQIRRDVENRRLDIVLGTYTMFERESSKDDRNFLRKLNFEYLILDEGHCIKNTTSSRYYNLMGLNVQRRLLLSGTPVQNNVGELLGVLSFLMPKMFTAQDCEMLIQAFDTSQTATITQLRGILAPFVLRRLKRDVLNQLVEKETTVLKVEMTPSQTSIYYDIIFAYKQRRERIMKKASDEQRAMDMVDGGARKKKKIQELLLQQKQASSTVTDPTVSDSADGVVDLTSPSGQDQPTIGVSAETAENKVETEVAAVNLVMECDTVTGDGSSGRTDSAFSSSASLSGSASNTALVDMSVAESTTVTTTTTPAVDLDIDGEVVDEVVASAVRELSATEAKHLFTALRKAANHPLLLRIRYSNEDDIERIARVALSNGYFGNQCDLARVKSEIVDYSDFDLHQICTMYPQYLSQYELPIEALFDSPKMVKLQEMIPKLLV